MKGLCAMKWILFTVGLGLFLFWSVLRITAGIQYNQTIGSEIYSATTAATPQEAESHLANAINMAKDRGYTHGNTGILFTYSDNDVGIWYNRLVSSDVVLKSLIENSKSELEVSNTMMRVHESLTAVGKEGSEARSPDGISVFPNNVAYAWLCLLSIVLMLVGGVVFIFIMDNY